MPIRLYTSPYRVTLRSTGLLFAFMFIISACSERESTQHTQLPVAITDADECHVCGMIINNFPGPKGEAYVRGRLTPLKFCSTRELFAYLLQPESRTVTGSVYVHDMATTSWTHPVDNNFIDARNAWYVVDHPQRGAMGATLAAFKSQQDAKTFTLQHGGRVLGFDDINLELIAQLGSDSL